MHFIDDVDFITGRYRTVTNPLDNLACIINTRMAGGIDFQNIDMASGGDGRTGLAGAAGFQRGVSGAIRPDTVETAREKPRCRGLANTTHTGQHKGMRQPPE